MSDLDAGSDEGFLRPEAEVLGTESLVPPANVVLPPPNRFTHRVVGETPYWFRTEEEAEVPDGTFPPGTKVVVLVVERGHRCRVVDERGLYVEVGSETLAVLDGP